MAYALDTKAKIIVEAALTTDLEAAERHDVDRSSIYRWRRQMEEDPELQRLVSMRWDEYRQADSWVQDATHTIRKAQSFIRSAAEHMDPSDPEALEAMTEALNTLTESLQMARIVDARLGTNRPDGEAGRQDDAGRIPPGND